MKRIEKEYPYKAVIEQDYFIDVNKELDKYGKTQYRASLNIRGKDSITGKRPAVKRSKSEVEREAIDLLIEKWKEYEDNGYTWSVGYSAPETIGELWESYINHTSKKIGRGSSQSTLNQRRGHYRKYISKLADLRLTTVTAHVIYNFLDTIPKEIPRKHVMITMRQMFAYADEMGFTSKNPTLYLKGMSWSEPKKDIPYSASEVAAMMKEMDALCPTDKEREVVMFIKLLIGLGARPGEIVTLTWGDVDLIRNSVIVNKTYVVSARSVKDGAKSKSGNRKLSITPYLLKSLKEYKKVCHQKNMADDNSYLFPSERNPLRPLDYNRAMRNRCVTFFRKHLSVDFRNFKTFRKTYSTIIANDVNRDPISYSVLQERLGHAKSDVTLRSYITVQKENYDYIDGIIESTLTGGI